MTTENLPAIHRPATSRALQMTTERRSKVSMSPEPWEADQPDATSMQDQADQNHDPAAADYSETDPGDSSHFDNFRAPELDEFGTVADDVVAVDEDGQAVDPGVDGPGDQMDMEAFWVMYSTAFAAPSMFNPHFGPLAIQDHEQQAGRAASDATYKLLQIYFPRLLTPAGETATLLFAAGMFAFGKAKVAQVCIANMQAEKIAIKRAQVEAAKRGHGPTGKSAANEPQPPQNSEGQGGYVSPFAGMDDEQAA